jgi:uncharacterized protein
LFTGQVTGHREDWLNPSRHEPKAREFHYPQGDDNVYTTYGGSGGIPISNAFRRLLFSARFKSLKVLLSDDITNESRVMFHRRVSDRVRRIAPFLQYETEPYLIISNGRLVWLQDAYTTSTRYPYATPVADGTNYIRNSIKVTVDAYHGTTTFYVVDETDPIARALRAIYLIGDASSRALLQGAESRRHTAPSGFLRHSTP